jgi:hypothetical protein
VLKNSLASDFITSAIFGFPLPGLFSVLLQPESNVTSAHRTTATQTTERHRESFLDSISVY